MIWNHCSHIMKHCSNIMKYCSNIMKHFSNIMKYCSNIMKHCSNIMKNCSNIIKHCSNIKEYCSNIMKHYSNIMNIVLILWKSQHVMNYWIQVVQSLTNIICWVGRINWLFGAKFYHLINFVRLIVQINNWFAKPFARRLCYS